MSTNICRGTATSASWNVTQCAANDFRTDLDQFLAKPVTNNGSTVFGIVRQDKKAFSCRGRQQFRVLMLEK